MNCSDLSVVSLDIRVKAEAAFGFVHAGMAGILSPDSEKLINAK